MAFSSGVFKKKDLIRRKILKQQEDLFSFDFLTCSPSGNLSWENQLNETLRLWPERLTYLTCDSSGNLSWEKKEIPMSKPDDPQEVEIENILTCDSSGKLLWSNELIIILPIPTP